MSTHSLCANNANVTQAIRCVGDLCLETRVFVGQMDAAPGLPSPLTPTDVPHSCRAPSRSGGKSVMRRNRLVNTQDNRARRCCAAARRCVNHAMVTAADERGRGAMRRLSVDARLTDASGLNGTVAVIHKLRG